MNANGVRDPGEDPGLLDADQVIWYVCNDIGVQQPWTNVESGIEQQTTIWGYARSDALGNAIFKRFRLFYKGIASTLTNATIDSMYIAQFTDTDIGAFNNDFAGCDSARSLGYGYNGDSIDADYAAFGLSPPAAGNDLLQGPIVFTSNSGDTAVFNFKKVTGAINLPMSSFLFFAASGTYSDPPFTVGGGIQWYQMLRGLPPFPQGPPDPPPFINPVTGQPSFFWNSGDPVNGTGWLDGIFDGPSDRRVFLSSGPFSMAVGDSQEIIVASVTGIGHSNLNSITILRDNDDMVQQWYDSLVAGIVTDVREPVPGLPNSFVLEQNYPNPFNPTTVLEFALPRESKVKLEVFNVLGERVATLVDRTLPAGRYEERFAPSGLASGVYLYRVTAGGFVETKKLLFLR